VRAAVGAGGDGPDVAGVPSVGVGGMAPIGLGGYVQAITGFADLTAADVGELLDRELACDRLRGIRQQLYFGGSPRDTSPHPPTPPSPVLAASRNHRGRN